MLLSDWYFCSCISMPPTRANAYLSLLEVLENPETNSTGLAVAYEELSRAEGWLQVYALPNVLRSLHRIEQAEVSRRAFDQYGARLTSLLPAQMQREYRDLLSLACAASPAEMIFKAIRRCLGVLRLSDQRQGSATPYIDCQEFLPESILLAVLADDLDREQRLRTYAPDILDKGTHPGRQMLDDALSHRLGRLAFTLALRVAASEATRHSRESLLALLEGGKYCSVRFEPDVLETYVTVFYDLASAAHGGRSADVARQLLQESCDLSVFRTLKGRQGREVERWGGVPSEPLGYVGYAANSRDLNEAIPAIYWQATLWDFATRLSPLTGAAFLGQCWQAPHGEPPSYLYTPVPASEIPREALAPLRTLLKIRSPDLRLNGSGVGDIAIEADRTWIFHSPWLQLHTDCLRDRGKDPSRYGAAVTDPPVLIRLAAGIAVAVRVLLGIAVLGEANRGDDDTDAAGVGVHGTPLRHSFLALVAHGWDVLSSYYMWGGYDSWLQYYGQGTTKKRPPRIPPEPMIALLLYTRDRIKLAGYGQLDPVAPEQFVELLSVGIITAPHPLSDLSQLLVDALEFQRYILPEVLMDWIYNSYAEAVDPEKGAGRWSRQIPAVYEALKRIPFEERDWTGNREAALVVRFLGPPGSRPDLRDLDWTVFKVRGKPLYWGAPARVFLLTPDLPAATWVQEAWPETSIKRGAIAARATERLAALDRGPLVPEAIASEWREEWHEALSGIGKSTDLDRFLRLRLLQLLDYPALEDDLDGQYLIVHLLLEFGNDYELSALFERVFPSEETAWTETVSLNRLKLRMVLLSAIYRDERLRRLQSIERLNMEDPRIARRARRRAQFLITGDVN